MYSLKKICFNIQGELGGSMVTSVHIRSTELFFLQEKKNLVLVLIRPLPLMSKGESIMVFE